MRPSLPIVERMFNKLYFELRTGPRGPAGEGTHARQATRVTEPDCARAAHVVCAVERSRYPRTRLDRRDRAGDDPGREKAGLGRRLRDLFDRAGFGGIGS